MGESLQDQEWAESLLQKEQEWGDQPLAGKKVTEEVVKKIEEEMMKLAGWVAPKEEELMMEAEKECVEKMRLCTEDAWLQMEKR